jgi:hypothetical protein
MDRRTFLRTSSGMAVAAPAMNGVFGPFFRVEASELLEPQSAAKKQTHDFIFDVQTHHVVMPSQNPHADPEFLDAVVGMRNMASKMNPALKGREGKIEDAYLENYIKEIFLDSDTDIVALSALPGESEETDVLTPEVIYKSRTWVNEISSSPESSVTATFRRIWANRMLSICMQTEKLKIDAWKGYSGVARAKGKQGWRMDDETHIGTEFSRKRDQEHLVAQGSPSPAIKLVEPHGCDQGRHGLPDLNFLIYHLASRACRTPA